MRATSAEASPPMADPKSPTRTRPAPAFCAANISPATMVRPFTFPTSRPRASVSTGMSPASTAPLGLAKMHVSPSITRNQSSPSIFGETWSGPWGKPLISSLPIAR